MTMPLLMSMIMLWIMVMNTGMLNLEHIYFWLLRPVINGLNSSGEVGLSSPTSPCCWPKH